jgi:DNA-binding CsgD family transcriptional regulator
MDRSDTDLLEVVDRLYAAALGEARWPDVLRGVTQFFDAAGLCVFDVDRRRGALVKWQAHGLDEGTDEYVAHINAIDPRMKFSMRRPAGHIAFDARFISEREMDRHEFYDWQFRRSGVRYFLGSRMRDEGDVSSMIGLNFTPGHGPPSEHDIQTFTIVRNHVRNAWLLWSRRDHGPIELPGFLSERVPWGVVTLDARGRILAMNGQAERIAAANDGLRVERGHLVAAQPAENRVLQGLVAAVLRAQASPALHEGGAVLVARPGLPGYVVQVLPNIRVGKSGAGPAAIIYISDPLMPATPDRNVLVSAFGLTPREADLALLMLRGDSLADAADSLAIARNTARNHLQAIFRKTGTNSQAGLIRVLGFLPTGS